MYFFEEWLGVPFDSQLRWSALQPPLWSPSAELASSTIDYLLCLSLDPGGYFLIISMPDGSWGQLGLAMSHVAAQIGRGGTLFHSNCWPCAEEKDVS